jgi:hypothetical protein
MSIEFESLIDNTLQTLGDPDGNYWSRDEIARYLNEGQLDFVQRTQCLRGQAPLLAREDSDTYTLPGDCLKILRVEGKKGTVIQPTTADRLGLSAFNVDKSTTNNDPTHYFSDLVGEGLIQFYPRPSSSLVAGRVNFATACLQPAILQTLGYVRAITSANGSLFAVDDTYVYEFFEERLVRQVAHTITSWGTDTYLRVTPKYRRVLLSALGNTSGWIIIGSGTRMVVIKEDGTIFEDASLPATVNGIAEVANDSKLIIWSGGGNIYQSNLDLSITISKGSYDPISDSISYSYFDEVSKTWVHATYYVSDGGLFQILSGSIINAIVGSFSAIAHDDNGTFYVQDATEIKTWTIGGSISTTSLTSRDVDELLGHSEGRLYFFDNDFNLVELHGTAESDCWAGYDIGNRHALINGTVYTVNALDPPDSLIYQMGKVVNDCGAIIDIDNLEFDGEEGVVADLVGTDVTNVDITSEPGIVTEIIDADEVARVFYVRCPRSGEVEIQDPSALEFYAVFRAYRKDAERTDFMKAEQNHRDYMRRVGYASNKANRGSGVSTHKTVRGSFF